MTSANSRRFAVGDVFEAVIEKIAHGGHFIAREAGAVFFIRHAVVGERCRIIVTSVGSSFNRGDVIEVIEPSQDRILAPCQYAHRDGCGGCDFQHISLPRQRLLKADVISEQFLRIAKMQINVEVEEVSAPLHWRTRAIATTDSHGKLGFYGSRSHRVVPVDDCIITDQEMRLQELATQKWNPGMRLEFAVSNTGERNIAIAPTNGQGRARLSEGNQILHQRVGGKVLDVSQSSFWQSNSNAPQVLTRAVLEYAQLQLGDHILDLYGGVGLFTAAMLDFIGQDGSIDLIEGSKSATADASRNFAKNCNVRIITGGVEKLLSRITEADVVVLDPPREGAGKVVVAQIARMKPRSVIYVACDPASLARDTAYFSEHGYSLIKIRAFDLFPMTHHIECVALLSPI